MNTNIGRTTGGGAARPGQMTMAMRAMPQASGPKVLRIGKVQGGRVIEERVIKQRTHVTIGSSHTNMFLAAGGGVPETMRLFELVGNDYVLNLTDSMTGRVALPTGITDLAQARQSGAAKRAGQHYQLKLTEDSRGKVILGETTFLFQFVAPPPVQPKPQLPLAVVGGVALIDWGFTIIAAFSFLAHFLLAGAANSDLFDPIVDDDLETAALIQQAKERPVLAIEEPKVAADATDKSKSKVDDGKKEPDPAAKAKPAGGGAGGAKGPAAGSMSAAKGAALSNELDALEMKALGSMGGTGPAQSNIMRPGSGATDSALDEAARRAGGADTGGTGMRTGSGGGGPLRPGEGNGKGLGGIGESKGGPGPGGPGVGDKSAEVKAPTGEATTGVASGASNVKDADSVISRNRYRFKSCFNKCLAADPNCGGTVRVQVKVGEGGEVTSATSAGGDAPASVTQCIVSSFTGMKFAEPEGGSATFNVPVVLSATKK